MSLTTFNTNYLKGSYIKDLTFLLQIAENDKLFASADNPDLPGLHPHIDNSKNLAIGYGYDFAANGTAQSIADLNLSTGVELFFQNETPGSKLKGSGCSQ